MGWTNRLLIPAATRQGLAQRRFAGPGIGQNGDPALSCPAGLRRFSVSCPVV